MSRHLYELIPEEGKHLADSHDTEGAVRGDYLDDETNKPCGAGEFMPVDIEDNEDCDSVGGHILTGIAIGCVGCVIGVVADKVSPYVQRWVTTTAVPEMEKLKFWRKVTKKGLASKPAIKCTDIEATPILLEPEKFSQDIDLAENDFYADTSNAEAPQHSQYHVRSHVHSKRNPATL